MLEDITSLTTKIFVQFLPNNTPINSKKTLYDIYRAMQKLIDSSQLVSEHYLALDFSEEFLQNSSFGEPSDKWRYFFNKDLEELNTNSKNYLLKLNHLAPKDAVNSCSSYISHIYRAKTYYSFVRDDYSVGYVAPCDLLLHSTTLIIKCDKNSSYLEKYSKIDLTTFEQRVALKNEIEEKIKLLQSDLRRLKEYIIKNFTLEDLL